MKEEFLAAENLNIGFVYPEEYKKFLNTWKKLYDTPWWLIGTSKGFFKTCFNVINIELGSKKLLIPFAKNDECNILACFDLSHRIWYCGLEDDDIANTDWNKRSSMPDFSTWLKAVLKDDL